MRTFVVRMARLIARALLPPDFSRPLMRLAVIAGSFVVYSAALVALFPTVGDVTLALSTVILAVVGYLVGINLSLLIGPLVLVASACILCVMGYDGFGVIAREWIGGLTTVAAGVGAGGIQRLVARMRRQERLLREQGEEMRRSRDELSARVAERTEELAEINRRLAHELSERRSIEEERRNLEARFLQAQKMEAVGRLAGGIAHDFNNLLTVIRGCCDLLMADEQATMDRAVVEEINKAATRGGRLALQLLSFSRHRSVRPDALDIGPLLLGMKDLLRRLIGEDVRLSVSIERDLWLSRVDPGKIEQIVMNLAVNSRDAMPQGGSLTIQASNVRVAEPFARMNPDATAGDHVLLEVNDTGCGMDETARQHLFEPFYTTKPHGTGLGLATAYGLIRQSDGFILCTSEPGRGTKFRIYLPRERQGPSDPLPAAEPRLSRAVAGGSETILLVEDEEPVRRLTEKILKKAGYTVFTACNGAQAISLLSQGDCRPHLVVSDVVMPVMGGAALAEQLAHVAPGVGVLFFSGFSEKAIVEAGKLEMGTPFLQKPFTAAALLEKVRGMLSAALDDLPAPL